MKKHKNLEEKREFRNKVKQVKSAQDSNFRTLKKGQKNKWVKLNYI